MQIRGFQQQIVKIKQVFIRSVYKYILKVDKLALVQRSLDGFRVLSLNFGGKWKKLAESRIPEIPTFRMYGDNRLIKPTR